MRSASILIVTSAIACAGARAAEPSRAHGAVELTYLGVAGWQITDGKAIVLVDPYFSRQPLPDDPSATIASDPDVVARYAPAKADLIVVGHSHFDHVLDAPAVAMRTGAQVMGSVSTARYARASGVPDDHIITVKGGEDFELGAFSVRVVPSLHRPLDDKHTFGGDIPDGVAAPLTLAQFGEGGTFAYLIRIGGEQVLAFDTANFVEREVEGLRPDVAIVAPGGKDVHDYACRLMRALGEPPTVIATHFDAWQTPIADERPRDDDTAADLRAFAGEIHACAPRTRVVIPVRGRAIRIVDGAPSP